MRGSERSFVALRPSGAFSFDWAGRGGGGDTHTFKHTVLARACRYTEAARHGEKT